MDTIYWFMIVYPQQEKIITEFIKDGLNNNELVTIIYGEGQNPIQLAVTFDNLNLEKEIDDRNIIMINGSSDFYQRKSLTDFSRLLLKSEHKAVSSGKNGIRCVRFLPDNFLNANSYHESIHQEDVINSQRFFSSFLCLYDSTKFNSHFLWADMIDIIRNHTHAIFLNKGSKTEFQTSNNRNSHTLYKELRTQLLTALRDKVKSDILYSCAHTSKSVAEIIQNQCLSRTTTYRKMSELVNDRLLVPQKSLGSKVGRKYQTYRTSSRMTELLDTNGSSYIDNLLTIIPQKS